MRKRDNQKTSSRWRTVEHAEIAAKYVPYCSVLSTRDTLLSIYTYINTHTHNSCRSSKDENVDCGCSSCPTLNLLRNRLRLQRLIGISIILIKTAIVTTSIEMIWTIFFQFKALNSVIMASATSSESCITEGKARIFSGSNVFYNPVQEFNRDMRWVNIE